MACAPVFSAMRRRKSPLAGAFFAPVGLSDLGLIQALLCISRDLVCAHSGSGSGAASSLVFQRANARSLVRKVKLLLALFESLGDSQPFPLPPSAILCFKELYIVLYRAKMLLDYCAQSSRLWLLLQNRQLSGHFHDLTLEIATLFDVLPLQSLRLSPDAGEQIELLQRQCRRSKLYIDPHGELLRLRIFSFLNDFEKGRTPDPAELRRVFITHLGIQDVQTCRAEIEFLEEQIYNQEEDADLSVLGGIVALTRYCRFLLHGFEVETEEDERSNLSGKKMRKGAAGEGSIAVPKDFCCPISLDLMKDPVMTSTGQTYDRASITQWMDEGHSTCPNSGQMLIHTRLVPNRALRSLISNWCAAHGLPYDPPDSSDGSSQGLAIACTSKAAIEAIRATAELLVTQLSGGSEDGKTIAAQELRLLAKTRKENRACIAEAGAIPHLRHLLHSSNPVVQENSVTALLNLSILDQNKSRIMEEDGCLRSIVNVLRHGWTIEARENAAATLFSLSAVHDYKKKIADESGAVEALAGLLREGSPRGKKDAVTALFNLSTHAECSERMLESGAIAALVEALEEEGVAEDAAGALALLVRRPNVMEIVGKEDTAMMGLMGLMRTGSPRGKENAVAALLEMCRAGGSALMQRVVSSPGLCGLIQTILFTGTKRARRKAASLARMCQRCDISVGAHFGGGLAMEYALATSRSIRRGPPFVSGDVSVSVAVAISVPVL